MIVIKLVDVAGLLLLLASALSRKRQPQSYSETARTFCSSVCSATSSLGCFGHSSGPLWDSTACFGAREMGFHLHPWKKIISRERDVGAECRFAGFIPLNSPTPVQENHKWVHLPWLSPLWSLEPAELTDYKGFAFRVNMEIQGKPHTRQLTSSNNYTSCIHHPNAPLPLQKHVLNS